MLAVRDLSCVRNEHVLFKNLCFKIHAGQGLQVHGANGAGKTTLLKTIAGLLPVESGSITTNASILYAGHRNNLHPFLTPLQNLQFLQSCTASAPRNVLITALAKVEINALHAKLCQDISAGQNQRIVLARLLLATQKLWLLDEPYVNLDNTGLELLYDICNAHLKKSGMIIMVTHRDINFCDHRLQLCSSV